MAGSGASDDDEVVFDAPHRIRVFTSGRVERCFGTDTSPASTDAESGVASKDHAISPDVAVCHYLPPAAMDAGVEDGGSSRLPVLVYFLGDGFCLLSAFNGIIHGYINSLAAPARAVVVSVEYRLAPEHPIPAAYEDSWRAPCWAASHLSGGGGGEDPWLTEHATSPACPSPARAPGRTSRTTWPCAPAPGSAASSWSTHTS
ncbi:putative carboxylesterase 13 [Dichanthelium oligosanthes]|uniref:Putative carboxylesterase 13 n=1 Tax=Dichanthelium oligosanthes TaxID=888268 RepID=A0A1E5WH24_9POAL|nr:putative carboxylesterase 13 [Dichanthelium oligosanthes]